MKIDGGKWKLTAYQNPTVLTFSQSRRYLPPCITQSRDQGSDAPADSVTTERRHYSIAHKKFQPIPLPTQLRKRGSSHVVTSKQG